MIAAMQLGRCVDEGRHARLRIGQLIVSEQTPEWVSIWPVRSIGGYWRFPKPVASGQIPPDSSWRDELQILWSAAIASMPCPQIELTGTDSAEDRQQVVEGLSVAARAALAQFTCPDWTSVGDGENWPPDTGWHFREREFAYGGQRYALPGKPLQLLRAVATARRPPSGDELQRTLWPDDLPEENQDPWKSLRRGISALNKKTAKCF